MLFLFLIRIKKFVYNRVVIKYVYLIDFIIYFYLLLLIHCLYFNKIKGGFIYIFVILFISILNIIIGFLF